MAPPARERLRAWLAPRKIQLWPYPRLKLTVGQYIYEYIYIYIHIYNIGVFIYERAPQMVGIFVLLAFGRPKVLVYIYIYTHMLYQIYISVLYTIILIAGPKTLATQVRLLD